MPTTRGIGRVSNNFDLTFKNDLISYLLKQHYAISINAIYTSNFTTNTYILAQGF